MEIKEKKLRILGKASASVLKKVQSRYAITIKENAILLFVGYTFNEYKTGSLFDIFIEESDKSWNHDYKIKLEKVYDECGTTYNSTPEGFKTLCLFECFPSIPAAIRKLPTLKTWDVTGKGLYFCNHVDIDLLNNRANGSSLLNSFEEAILSGLHQKSKKSFTEQDIAEVFRLPDSPLRLIIDDMILSGALRNANDKLVLAE